MKKERYLAQQMQRLTNGQINRRRFVMSALATGVTLPTAMSLATRAEAQTPQRGGLFRHGSSMGSTTDVLDPGTAENEFTISLCYVRGNHLCAISNENVLEPELAASYEPGKDASEWIFDLREGVEFHDGKTMTADDVIASFRHHMGEDTKSAAKGLLTQVNEIVKDGDNRVIFRLANQNADFPFIVSDYHLVIMPSADGALIDPNGPVATGPYKIDSFEPGVRATFTRHPNYFKEDRAHFDAVEMIALLDTTARQNAVMNGEVDYIDGVDPKTVALMQRVPNLEILEVTGSQHYTFPMRLDTAPFDNYDLRMALKLAIDRQELVDKVLLGFGQAGNDVPFTDATPYYNTELPSHAYDPERAAEHYKKSGHSGPIQLSVSDAAFPGAVNAGQLIAASAANAGIEIEIVREPADGYWSNVWNKKGWCACYWSGRPTQDWMYSAAYTNDTEWNDTAWKDTEAAQRFNEVVVEARAETDEAKRKDLYWEAQRLLQDDGGAIVAMFASYLSAHTNRLAHVDEVASNWADDGHKHFERWWFTS